MRQPPTQGGHTNCSVSSLQQKSSELWSLPARIVKRQNNVASRLLVALFYSTPPLDPPPPPLAGSIAMSPAVASASSGDRIRTYEDFVRVHAYLLAAAGIPPSLHRRLYRKLADEVFDGGEVFAVEPCEDGRQRRLVLTADQSLGKESDVFLVDHAWSFRLPDALKQVSGL